MMKKPIILLFLKLVTFVECEWFFLWLQATLLSGSMYFISCVGFALVTGLLAGYLFGAFRYRRFVIAGLCLLAMAVGIYFQRTQVERFLTPVQTQNQAFKNEKFSIRPTLIKRAILAGFGMGEWFNVIPVDRKLSAYLRNMTAESMLSIDIALRISGMKLPEFCHDLPLRVCALNFQEEMLAGIPFSTAGLSFISGLVDILANKEFNQGSDSKNSCLDIEQDTLLLKLGTGRMVYAGKILQSLLSKTENSVTVGFGRVCLSQGDFTHELEHLIVMRFLSQQLSVGEMLVKNRSGLDSTRKCSDDQAAFETAKEEFLAVTREYSGIKNWEKQIEEIAVNVDALKSEWRNRGLWLRFEEIILPESAHQSYSRFSL